MAYQVRRDFTGYGGNPPDPKWPNGARLAVNFVLNYEEGSEPSMQDGEGHTDIGLTEAHGMTFKDFTQERLDPGKSADAIKDKKLDAFFWVGGIPTAAVTELAATPGVKIKLIDHDDGVAGMNKIYGPLYVRDTIPAKAYPGQEQPNRIATVWNVLLARADVSDQVAYDIVRTIFERKAEMERVHPESRNFDYKYQTNAAAVIPFHPGAVKYFAEKGVKLQ